MKRLMLGLLVAGVLSAQSRQDVLRAMRKAADFYRTKVSTEGGYHYYYTPDLTYGRSEHGEGLSQVEVQREATPIVALAYLDAFELTAERAYLNYAVDAARALVRGQVCSGGWDYLIEFDKDKRKKYQYRADDNCAEDRIGVTNLDDNVSQAAVRVMMRVDRELEFKDKPIHEATLFALEKLLAAQYANGAWPQRFRKPAAGGPAKKASYPESSPRKWPGTDYQGHYTFNDGSIADAIDMMLEASRIYKDSRYRASAEKGGDFILLAQMPDPQPAWAQQYDVDMHPVWARVFEPASVTGGESQGIMRVLMMLYRETGNRKYLEPIPRALAYLKRSFVERTGDEVFRRLPEGPVLARFYELHTNKPLYITQGTRANGKVVTGYEVSYSPASVITHYSVLINGRDLANIERDYNQLLKADPSRLKRPDRLHGLSPWSGERGPRKPSQGEVKKLIDSMDERGAWITGDPERVIRSSVFARNLTTLAEYVTTGSATQ